MFACIEYFFNQTRRHLTLGYLSPVQFEQAPEAQVVAHGTGSSPRQENAYLDERWENGRELPEPGKALLQRRVDWLLTQLGAQTRDVLATNLIFMQSRDASGVSQDLADVCWPVHETLPSIVRPSLIIAFGNSTFSPYGYLHGRLGGEQRYGRSGHGDWMLKGFDARMPWGSVFVAGLPHLSRYDPTGKQCVVDWIESGGQSSRAL